MDSDATLFSAWCAGDQRAGAALFDRHYEPIARFFHNKVDDAASGDLVQATFLACTEARARFEGASSFRTFLFAIAHNLLRKHYRARRVQAARRAPGGGSEDEPDFSVTCAADLGPSASTALRNQEEMRLVLESLRRIPVECQEVLELHYWEQLDTAEIGEIVGVPQGTVKSRLQRGRRLLAEELARLSEPGALRDRTLTNLDGWATGLRERLLAR